MSRVTDLMFTQKRSTKRLQVCDQHTMWTKIMKGWEGVQMSQKETHDGFVQYRVFIFTFEMMRDHETFGHDKDKKKNAFWLQSMCAYKEMKRGTLSEKKACLRADDYMWFICLSERTKRDSRVSFYSVQWTNVNVSWVWQHQIRSVSRFEHGEDHMVYVFHDTMI